MINSPLISVIVPVYNVEKYLTRCIDSIINQTYKNTEIILVDDGSKDASGSICDEYKGKNDNVIVIHKENGGLSSARNAALDIATGDYIAFVDSDDWIRPEMLSTLLRLLTENNCDVASCSYSFCKELNDRRENAASTNPIVLEGESILAFYMKSSFENTIGEYPVWNKLYKADLFSNLRFPIGVTYEDMLPTFTLLERASRFVKTQESLYCYFVNPGSITHGKLRNKDFYLLNVCDSFIEKAKVLGNKEVLHYAYLKKYRTYYSLLAKGLIYGVDPDVENYKEKEAKLLKLLRTHKKQLLKSGMDRKRKILITMICLNPKLVNASAPLLRRCK